MAYLQGVASSKCGSESQQQGSDHYTQMTLSSMECDVTLAVCQSLMCSKYNRRVHARGGKQAHHDWRCIPETKLRDVVFKITYCRNAELQTLTL